MLHTFLDLSLNEKVNEIIKRVKNVTLVEKSNNRFSPTQTFKHNQLLTFNLDFVWGHSIFTF